jgi:hypothetical protein
MKPAIPIAERARPKILQAVPLAVVLATCEAFAKTLSHIYENGAGCMAFDASTGGVSNSPPRNPVHV